MVYSTRGYALASNDHGSFDREQDASDDSAVADSDPALADDGTDDVDVGSRAAAGGDDAADGPDPPLWTTPDGHVLHLTPDVLDSFVIWLHRRRGAPRRPRRWRRGRGRPQPRPAERRRAVSGVARVVRRARRAGTLRHRATGRRYPVFRARSGRTRVRIIARPRRGGRFEIIGMESEAGPLGSGFLADELEVLAARDPQAWRRDSSGARRRVRGALARITWTGPLALKDAAKLQKGGVYVIYRDERPIYVGETGSFRLRFGLRTEVLRSLGIPTSPWSVYLGDIEQTGGPKVAAVLMRQDIEHVLVRYLKQRKRLDLTNLKPRETLIANTGGIRLENVSGKPPHLPTKLSVKPGAELEADVAASTPPW